MGNGVVVSNSGVLVRRFAFYRALAAKGIGSRILLNFWEIEYTKNRN